MSNASDAVVGSGVEVTTKVYPKLGHAARLADDGKFEQAAQVIIGHLRQHPDEPRGLAMLGQTAMQLGALGQAENFLRRAITRGANELTVRRQLASVLNQQERLDEAKPMFEQLATESTDPTLSAILANILEKLGRNEEALPIQQRLTGENPDRPPFWISYGYGLRSVGRVDEAIAAYRRATETDYEYGEAWWGLASIRKKIFTDADIATMRKALEIAIDIRNSAPLHFAIARALHDRGEYEQAFAHYTEGNRQRAESLQYDAAELSAEIDEVERTVDGALLQRFEGGAIGDVTPVFVVSLPRSGSTLLEQMLGSHASIEAAGELPYVPALLRSAMEMATRRGRVTVPQLIAALPAARATALGREYLRRAALHRRTDRPFFIDKLPHNWNNVLFIRRILPQARFIDIRRAPMDCCFANFCQSFSGAHSASFTLHDVAQSYVDYVRAMTHLDRVAPGLVDHVGYEDLIEQPERELRRLLASLGLPWDRSVLEFHRLDRVVRTPSSEQVRRPLNREGMEIWQPYAQWLEPLRQALGPLAENQGG
jgi:tetratricopeptide (TPR) repeat protein